MLRGSLLKNKTRKRIFMFLIYLYLVILALCVLLPFYWMFITSFKYEADIMGSATIIPPRLTLENYYNAIFTSRIPRWIFNSVVISVTSTFLGLFLCSLGGFVFAKYNFPGKLPLFILVLITQSISPFVTIIPIFVVLRGLSLLNSYLSVILPLSAHMLGLFLMKQYIEQLPDELMDAARMDGCSEFKIYLKIILPVIKPAIGAAGIYIFLTAYNEYFIPLVMMRTADMYPMQVGLETLHTIYDIKYGMIMAGSVLLTLPVMIFFLFLQREFVAGLTVGAVKG